MNTKPTWVRWAVYLYSYWLACSRKFVAIFVWTPTVTWRALDTVVQSVSPALGCKTAGSCGPSSHSLTFTLAWRQRFWKNEKMKKSNALKCYLGGTFNFPNKPAIVWKKERRKQRQSRWTNKQTNKQANKQTSQQ